MDETALLTVGSRAYWLVRNSHSLQFLNRLRQILDREGEVAESACLRIGRAIGGVWESE